jgi:hypothetical protein
MEQEDPLDLIAAALFSKPPTYICTVKMTNSRVDPYESLSRILEGKKLLEQL